MPPPIEFISDEIIRIPISNCALPALLNELRVGGKAVAEIRRCNTTHTLKLRGHVAKNSMFL
jgi:hypothetical protein